MKDKNVGHIIKLLENYEQFKEAAIAIKNSRMWGWMSDYISFK